MSNWAGYAIRRLEEGKRATIRPKGFSMKPKIESGAEVELSPVEEGDIEVGDIVLVRIAGRIYLHLVSGKDRGRVQISNNKGHVNGWVGFNAVLGRATRINNNPKDPKSNGKPVPRKSAKTQSKPVS